MGVGNIRIVVVALVVALLGACSRPLPEQALRERFGELQQTLDARDSRAMQEFLARDFVGNDGIDRDQMRRMAALYFQRFSSIGLVPGPLTVDLQPPANAQVRFRALASAGQGGLLPERARAWRVETAWRVEGGTWLMYHARWTPEF